MPLCPVPWQIKKRQDRSKNRQKAQQIKPFSQAAGKKGCNGIALRMIEKEEIGSKQPIQEEYRRCRRTQKGQCPADVMYLWAKPTGKQKDWIEDQQNVDAVGMQVQQIPDREPLPRGTQHCSQRPRKAQSIEDLLAPATVMNCIVPADKDIDAAQMQWKICHIPLAGVQQNRLFHKLICQHQNKHSAKDLMPGHFLTAVVDHRTEKKWPPLLPAIPPNALH